MKIIEIFDSIQGEGPAMGKPATFVRLAGCNLKCKGCDTDQKNWQELSTSEIAQRAVRFRTIITGGEPTLQIVELSELISILCENGREVHIETNGTNRMPQETLCQIYYAIVSPKVGSNFNIDYWRDKENVHLKFVIGRAPWCWNAISIENLIPNLDRERVWLMTYGVDQNMQDAKDTWELALRLDVNYSDRLHIRLKGR